MILPNIVDRLRYRRHCLAIVFLLAGCAAPASRSTAPAAQVTAPAATTAASATLGVAPATSPSPSALPIPEATPAASSSPAPSIAPASAEAATAFSGQLALDTVRLLSETIGSRPAGSDAERRAAEVLADEFRRLGWTTEIQQFPIRSFQDRGSSLRVNNESGAPIEVLALQNSAPGTISGRLIEVGLGRSEDLAGLDLNGAIALIQRGEISFGDKVRNVAAAGAVGAVIVNQTDDSFRGLLPDSSPIPAVGIDGATGRRLFESARQAELQAELIVDTSIAATTSNNVVATLDGASDETVVLGAHYDSVAEGPGANDNASGSATVLELARTLPAAELPVDVRVVLFGAEEIGLVGSRYYVDSLGPREREQIAAMLNFDMVGVGDRAMVGGSDDLVQLAQEAASEQGVELGELGSSLDGRGDHAPFLDAGVPILFFHRQDDPRYHTADDRAEYVAVEGLEVAGRLAFALLDAVAELRMEN